jgi:hypothetical protein
MATASPLRPSTAGLAATKPSAALSAGRLGITPTEYRTRFATTKPSFIQ